MSHLHKFEIVPVKLPVSSPRPGKQLIGFDKSFCCNREQDYHPNFDIDAILTSEYKHIKFDNLGCFIDELNLRIDYRFGRDHNFTAWNKSDKFHKHCLNILIESGRDKMIDQWCIIDVERRRSMSAQSNYLELFEVENSLDLITQIRRACNGLEYFYTEKEIATELDTINKTMGSFEKNAANNKCVLTYQPHFYKRENELYIKDVEWRRKLIDNCKAFLYKKEYELNDKEMLRQIKIAGLHMSFSHHSSYWIKAFINKYNITYIADPCSGWGQRLIGARNIKYISNDIDPQTIAGQKKVQQLIGSDVIFYCQDAGSFFPTEDYQAVFTCPPYFDTEEYFTDQTSTVQFPTLNSWLDIWWRNVIKNWFKPNTQYFAFIINNEYKDQMKEVCLEEGLVLLEEIRIGKANNLNHFQRTATNSFKGEWCLVFTH